MIDSLSKICSENLIKNKILLVPSYAAGQNIMKMLTEKTSVVNLRIETIQSIAIEAAKHLLHDKGLIAANDSISRHTLFRILHDMQQNNEFEYFSGVQITPVISNSIWNTVMEIKQACLNHDTINEASFICGEKGRDIKKILAEYDLEMERQGLCDHPTLLKIAMENRNNEDVLMLVPNYIKLCLLEKKFLTEKFRSIQILFNQPLNGVDLPNSYYSTNYPEKPLQQSPFSNLYALDDNCNHDDYSNIRLIKAYGENNEVEAVLRSIKGISYDQTCIYVTSQEPYAQLLYQKAAQLGIPVTFGYGLSVLNSKPGKAFNAFVKWIENNFQVSDLTNMLYQQLIQIPDHNGISIKLNKAANLLRASGIGWGRERYLSVLNDYLKQIEKTENNGYKTEKTEAYKAVTHFIKCLFDEIPAESESCISVNGLAKGMSSIISQFVPVKNELDAEAKLAITECLEQIYSVADLFVDIEQALQIIKSTVKSIRIAVSSPKKGHIHLCSFNSGFYINRLHNYFLGLDADRFPGNAAEDPILLDTEKEKLSKDIIQNKGKTKEKIYAMVQLLSGLNGNIALIYSSFDPVENRDKTPSSLILQVYRMISKNASADYSDLKKYYNKIEGYLTENALDESEFWLNRCFKAAQGSNIKESVFECYPHLKQGETAWEQQNTEKFTHYDGYVGRLSIKDDRKFSASKLELLAKCPYQYYLKHVLYISPPDEMSYDPETWLDPLTRGSLYHTIFEQFYKDISERGEKPNREKHSALILDIAKTVINKLKEQIPPPSEIVFETQRHELLESCLIFLAGEEENIDKGIPVDFEFGFGLGDDKNPPVEVTLPSDRKFLLSGKIDRVDKLGENTYRIIDYKSGGTYGYSDRDFFKQGRQIQHALYAYALEVLLEKNGRGKANVTEGIYLFPTKKGEGQRFIRTARDDSTFFELLDDLFTIIEEGTFAATLEVSDCRFCEYQMICRIDRIQKVIEKKRSDPTVEALSALRRLVDYE